MTWVCHKIFTAAVVYGITARPVPAVLIALGSVIPDVIEMAVSGGMGSKRWKKIHRGICHWFVLYVAMAIPLFWFASEHGVMGINLTELVKSVKYNPRSLYWYAVVSYVVALLMFGAVAHIFEDGLCGRIPSLNPSKKIGMKLFEVRTFKEIIFVGVVSATVILMRLSLQ
jgi:hypothetical protein